jgi:Flp pilus assembly pilin Flp
MLQLLVAVQTVLSSRWRRDERGQATAEYALVLLGAAAVALLVVAWAAKTDLVGKLFDGVLTSVTGKASQP